MEMLEISNMKYRYLLSFFCVAFASHVVQCRIELIMPTTTISVNESSTRHVTLIPESDPIICRDTRGDLTRAILQSVTPRVPCTACLALLPCGSGNSRFCLVYQASQGKFSYRSVRSYTALISCTNDQDPPETATLHVRVVANFPPQFNPPGLFERAEVSNTRAKGPGFEVYTVAVIDEENDPVFFSMYTVPESKLFAIGYGSGIITATKDLRHLCERHVSFYVTIWDPYHTPVGPKIIHAEFKDANERPQIRTTDHTVEIPEDTSPTTAILVLDVEDTTIYPNIELYMTSIYRGAHDLYYVSGGRLRVRRALDFEYEATRETSLTIQAFDGFCYSEDYDVRVVITNVNEEFELQPDFFEPIIYEGVLNYQPDITIVDQDTDDGYTFRKTDGNPRVNVQSDNGRVTTLETIDIDPNRDKRNVPVTVEVADTANNKRRFEVNITVLDSNDNTPVFARGTYALTVDNCTQIGTVLDKVAASDEDSSLNGNNILVFSGRGRSFTILPDGSILYRSPLSVGDVDVGSADVMDQGLVPGPLQGESTVVTITCELCPGTTTITIPTTTTVTTTTVATTTAWTRPRSLEASEVLRASDKSTNTRAWHSHNVGWIAAAATVFALLLVLSSFALYRVCAARTSHKTLRHVTEAEVKPGQKKKPTSDKTSDLKNKPPPPIPPPLAAPPLVFVPPLPQQQQYRQIPKPQPQPQQQPQQQYRQIPKPQPQQPSSSVPQPEKKEAPEGPQQQQNGETAAAAEQQSSVAHADQPDSHPVFESDEAAIQDVAMLPPPLYTSSHQPKEPAQKPPQPRGEITSAEAAEQSKPKEKTKAADKTTGERDKKTEKAKAGTNKEDHMTGLLQDIYPKPQMHKGNEVIDLDIITPRDSPLLPPID